MHVADSIPCRLSGASNAVARTHALRPPRYAAAGFVADLQRIIGAERIDMVLPTCEEVFYLSRYRPCLPAGTWVAVDDFDKLRALHSKWEFLRLARDCGATVPASARVQTLAQARDWAAGRPLVLKPEYSRFGVHVRLYPQGMPAQADALPAQGSWVAQAFHSGTELCSYGIAHQGRLLAHAAYRPAYRIRRSSSFYFEPVEHDAIHSFVAAFVRKIAYSGQISFDWIESADGDLAVLECNPRAISGLHLFSLDAGLPSALAGDGDCQLARGAQPRMITSLMLSLGLPASLRRGGWRDWLADYRRAGDVISIAGDRLPLAGALSDLASYAGLAAKQRCNLREAATRDIEWDGEALDAVAP